MNVEDSRKKSSQREETNVEDSRKKSSQRERK